mgnify:CR=1 FL=1
MRKIFIVLLMSLFFISPVYADNHVVNVSYDGKVTTASGEAPTLPLKAKVTFYDGSEKEYNIDWNTFDESLYKTRNASQFTVTGSIADLQVTTSCIVNVEAAKITHINELANKTVTIGEALSLPATASVTWSNGDQSNEIIRWDNYDNNALKYVHTFSLNGHIYDQTITQTVHVKYASVTSVSVPAVVYTTTGVDNYHNMRLLVILIRQVKRSRLSGIIRFLMKQVNIQFMVSYISLHVKYQYE